MSYDANGNDPDLSPDENNGPGDEPRPSNTLSIEIPKRDVVDNDSDEEDGEGGEGGEDEENLSDSEERRREEAGLNSPTGANANDSQNASYASAVNGDEDDGPARDERGPRSPRRISKNAQVSWMADEQKQAGGAVTQADEEPPAALAAMLTQVDKPGTSSGNPITSVPRDQPTTATRQESDNTDAEIRRVSQQSQQRGSWLACCSWLNCSNNAEIIDDDEPTIAGGQPSVDLAQRTTPQPTSSRAGEPGGPRGAFDDCDGGYEASVDYPDAYYDDGLLPRPLERHKRQKCLVLDLDETLVHSSFKPVPNADFIIPVEIDGVIHRVYVMKRPYVDEFLIRCARKYEVVVFTASLAKYANPLLDQLDPHGTVTHRLFRESCVIHQTAYVKDLTRLARPISKTIIVDNSAQSYLFQPKNAIPIPSWFDDMTDTMLMDLLPVLETTMWEIPDVRKLLDAHTKSYRWLCNQANKTEEFS